MNFGVDGFGLAYALFAFSNNLRPGTSNDIRDTNTFSLKLLLYGLTSVLTQPLHPLLSDVSSTMSLEFVDQMRHSGSPAPNPPEAPPLGRTPEMRNPHDLAPNIPNSSTPGATPTSTKRLRGPPKKRDGVNNAVQNGAKGDSLEKTNEVYNPSSEDESLAANLSKKRARKSREGVSSDKIVQEREQLLLDTHWAKSEEEKDVMRALRVFNEAYESVSLS